MCPQRDPAAAAAHIARALAAERIDYAIGGALALAAYGIPRMTLDVDLAVFIDANRHEALLETLERAGCLFERDRARADLREVRLFTVRCLGVLADLFVSDPGHPFRDRRVALEGPDGGDLWFLSPEDYAVHKLALHRAQDVADLERLFAVGGLDVAYLQRWLERIVPDASDPRRATLEDLVRRFA